MDRTQQDESLQNQLSELTAACKLAESLLSRINKAFYVDGTTKALRPVMAETKAALSTIRKTITEATP